MNEMGGKLLRGFGPGLAGAAAALLLGAGGAALAAPRDLAGTVPSSAPHYLQVAGLFGESDEEKAARLAAEQREQAQDASIGSLLQRVGDLERALRQLTGQLEDANHRDMLLQQKIDRMQKDFDYRLCQLSAQQLGGSSDGAGIDCTAALSGSPAPASAPSSPAPGGYSQQGALPPPSDGRQMGRASGVLGTLPAGSAAPPPRSDVSVNMNAVGGPQAASPARAQFDTAMNILAKGQYDDARAAFRSLADAHPKDDLAPQAVYWVGSIAFVQKDYQGAARAFAEEIKNYPESPRGPESMLKLGQSLIAMKQKKEGCTTLGALSSKYPKASKTVRRDAQKARDDAGCN